jgi:hypothetical protein
MPELVERADKPGVIGARRGDDVLRVRGASSSLLKQKRIGAQPVDKLFLRPGRGQAHLLRA